MPDTLPSLEKQKAQLLHEISQLGDQRRGSITTPTYSPRGAPQDRAGGQRVVVRKRAVQLPLPQGAGADIPVLYIEMDGTGVPMVAAETAGRAGKSDSERARTREIKLGCVFTQPECEQDGRPVREEASTSYSGSDRGRRAV